MGDTEKKSKQSPTAEKSARKFTLASLGKKSYELFEVSHSTFAGATSELPEGEYTIEEVRKHIASWGKREVK